MLRWDDCNEVGCLDQGEETPQRTAQIVSEMGRQRQGRE